MHMNKTRINDIRETIALAKAHEANTHDLANMLRNNISRLHATIEFPHEDAVSILKDFIIRYIEQVPEFIEIFSVLTKDAGIYDYVSTFLAIAQDYFLKPPDAVSRQVGLASLMDQAYLSHRLIEEINDRFIGRCGIPLAPMDMTRSNLIMHHLISEPFANELDLAVQYSLELLMAKEEQVFNSPDFLRYAEQRKARGWSEELSRWPCLASDLAIQLNFGRQNTETPSNLH